MKLKHTFLLIAVIFSIGLKAQSNNKIEVIYKKNLYNHTFNNDDKNVTNALNKVIKKTQEAVKDLNFKLSIIENESIFKLNENLATEESELYSKLAISHGGGAGNYYNNLKENKIIHQKEVGGNLFLITSNYDTFKWIFDNETKQVGKHLCYKAVTTITINNRDHTKKEVVAWYCPKIPFGFGPVGYGGLPGLILELEIEKSASFKVDEIIFNPKKIKVKKPLKGTKMTVEEYFKESKKTYNRRING